MICDAQISYIAWYSDTPPSAYGTLHTIWQGLLVKYPPSSGKKLFMFTYFGYKSIGNFWDAWETPKGM